MITTTTLVIGVLIVIAGLVWSQINKKVDVEEPAGLRPQMTESDWDYYIESLLKESEDKGKNDTK